MRSFGTNPIIHTESDGTIDLVDAIDHSKSGDLNLEIQRKDHGDLIKGEGQDLGTGTKITAGGQVQGLGQDLDQDPGQGQKRN